MDEPSSLLSSQAGERNGQNGPTGVSTTEVRGADPNSLYAPGVPQDTITSGSESVEAAIAGEQWQKQVLFKVSFAIAPGEKVQTFT